LEEEGTVVVENVKLDLLGCEYGSGDIVDVSCDNGIAWANGAQGMFGTMGTLLLVVRLLVTGIVLLVVTGIVLLVVTGIVLL
jgi:hypothetical protein